MSLSSLKQLFATRHQILWVIVLLYLMPLALLSLFGSTSTWNWWTMGLLAMLVGSLLLFVILQQWESDLAAAIASEFAPPEGRPQLVEVSVLEEVQEQKRQVENQLTASVQHKEALEQELSDSKNEILSLIKEKERAFRQIDQVMREFHQFKEASEEKLEQNHIFLGEYQQTIHEQRAVIEAKQQQIEHLDSKVRDLTYEIKTLLQLAEKSPIHERQKKLPDDVVEEDVNEALEAKPLGSEITDSDISSQLKRCIEMAQKITGSSHHGSKQPRSRELPIDNYALDFRRLCDGLHHESTNAILVFSQKENKLLFVNQAIKDLLGWQKDKFSQHFTEIMHESQNAWNNILSQLAYKNECQAELSLKAKNGQQLTVNCHVGVIPTGLFRSNIIAILS